MSLNSRREPTLEFQPEPKTRLQLRKYQLDDLQRIEDHINCGSRSVLCQGATGSGKTEVMAELVSRSNQKHSRSLILTHRSEILEQTIAALRRRGLSYGVVSPDFPIEDAINQVASVQSLIRRLDWLEYDFLPNFCFIDEAHHVAAKTWIKILDALPSRCVKIGFTATPLRLDGKGLDDIFDDLVVGLSIRELIELGYLSKVTVFIPAQDLDLTGIHTRAGDYDLGELSQLMGRRVIVEAAVDEYEKICPGAPSIAFAVNIEHSKMVCSAFRQRGWRAEHLDGDTPRKERKRIIAELASGELHVASNCGLISEGLDVPGVVSVTDLRPTKSLALCVAGPCGRRPARTWLMSSITPATP
jgi:DNA repair protein RadD